MNRTRKRNKPKEITVCSTCRFKNPLKWTITTRTMHPCKLCKFKNIYAMHHKLCEKCIESYLACAMCYGVNLHMLQKSPIWDLLNILPSEQCYEFFQFYDDLKENPTNNVINTFDKIVDKLEILCLGCGLMAEFKKINFNL